MPKFTYKVKDAIGISLTGTVEAGNLKFASNLLHDRGYFIISLREQSSRRINPFPVGTGGISYNDTVNLTRQIATMLTAGLTLVESLSILFAQVKKRSLVKLIGQIEDDVKGGKSFTMSLSRYPNVFSPAYLALVRAGEASGKLDIILTRLADSMEKSREFRNKVRGAMVYPSIVVSGMGIVTVIVMTVVVPRLTSLYAEFNVELPVVTQIFISLSLFSAKYWWILVVLFFITAIFFVRFRSTWFGQHIISAIALNFPVFGSLFKEATLVEVTRTLAILVDSGVPILTSLEIAQRATGNVIYQEAINLAAKKVEKGFPLSDTFIENNLFPPILGQMISVGEQTGKLGDSLIKLSRYFETEADSAVRGLTTMIEPFIMIVLGVGVGFLVLAVLMPIYSLTSKF